MEADNIVTTRSVADFERRSDFWMKVAGVAFGLWSLFIPFGVYVVRDSVAEAVSSQADFQKQFGAYVLAVERRITLLEERQARVLTRLDQIENYHERYADIQRGKNGNGNGNGLRNP